MQTKNSTGLIIGSVGIFLLGAVTSYAAGWNWPGQNGNRLEETEAAICPAIGQAERLFRSENRKCQFLGGLIGEAWATTEPGHQQLRSMLLSADKNSVGFAAYSIHFACNLSDIPLLLQAARTHQQDTATVRQCMSAIGFLLGVPGAYSSGNKSNLDEVSQWLDDNKELWINTSYAEYWGGKLLAALLTMREDNAQWESQEYFGQTLFTMLRSHDATRSVPAIMKVLSETSPKTDSEAIWPLLHALQVYVGPMALPTIGKNDALAEKRQHVLSWWNENSARRPGQWVISVLSERGISLDIETPATVTAWINKALREGSAADQYAATLVLIYAFPHSKDIPFPDGIFLVTGGEPKNPLSAYLLQCRLAQAAYWSMMPWALTWDAQKGMYIFR